MPKRGRVRKKVGCGVSSDPVVTARASIDVLPAFAAVAAGASCGAWLRWGLSSWLNPLTQPVPLGTLTANLVGGYLIGVAMALLAQQPQWPAEVRLFVVTGFLGGLTTFSTFSAEVVTLLLQGRYLWGVGTALLHLLGSLFMTVLGLWSAGGLRALSQH
ncbi:MAG: fluoride efflux transporter CrcB [Magnetococcales bacterium]|nr:fluoride efflux transporter CrcB [Magnetococcales bacterium]